MAFVDHEKTKIIFFFKKKTKHSINQISQIRERERKNSLIFHNFNEEEKIE